LRWGAAVPFTNPSFAGELKQFLGAESQLAALADFLRLT